jgi:hypothetical protein
MSTDIPEGIDVRLRSLPLTTAHVSMIRRGDVLAYNEETAQLEVWGLRGGKSVVVFTHHLEVFVGRPFDYEAFENLADLIGRVAQISGTVREVAPDPWWAVRYLM